ncbi:UDP-N-acetylmuramoyl-L-alanine--D-glutamate ligase [Algihabitans albus]|uniref:UDP-N-acetylmuramoyl-L-alanine--D-glutamate ligase n=1 Tax=Algihabitans albus TaxID=2164067 RepID=UPI000E5CE26E|nr:UDP-N-acetylmuramoyl-L-alanine--D-glutamate ligase [Algihabitans albus]
MIELPFFHGLPVGVLGLGSSGLAAARALQASGAEVWAWDDNEDARAHAAERGIPLVDLHRCDWQEPTSLILSPGIPHRYPAPHPVVELARDAGAEIIGDVELLGRAQADARYIGITGTNGKSTTTALLGHMLQLCNLDAQIGGNIGLPVMDLAPAGNSGTYVLEMSSYQLELTFCITFDIAVLLNITPDHLERHGGFDGYVAAKKEIFRRQTSPRTAIVGLDDETCRALHDELAAAGDQRVIGISAEREVPGGVYVIDGVLYDELDGRRVPAIDLYEVGSLPGRHNWQNAAAAYAAGRACQVDGAPLAASIRSFAGLPHRQERVTAIEGIAYVNDSKATNPEAAAKALASYPTIYWIAGGRPKDGGLEPCLPHLDKVAEAFLIGEASESFAAELEGKVTLQRCGDLATALAAATVAARRDGKPNPVVLLSPAAASFDQFASFEQRGDTFRRAVEAIPGEREEELV